MFHYLYQNRLLQGHCDEIHFKIRREARWLFAVMDGASRFILSHDVSATKLNYNPAPLFVAARNLAGTAPWVLATDGLQAFCPAARRAFWSHNSFMLIHVREIHLRNRFSHNNKHERLNGEFRDRIKTVREFGTESPALVRLMIVHHNFFRPHGGIGKMTPAGAAGIIISGTDKQITLISNAAVHAA